MNENLIELSRLIKLRNKIEDEVAKIIERPFIIGHVGEYIASEIFDIELNESASEKGHDGYFRSGLLAGCSVNVKYYSRKGSILDMCLTDEPEYYLVLMGSSKDRVSCPWNIESVYLFNDFELRKELNGKVKIGTATSVRRKYWDEAMVYPTYMEKRINLDEKMIKKLKLFEYVGKHTSQIHVVYVN